jgi:hypothetical protein
MMGATTLPIDKIAATTREYNPNFQGIDRDDSNHTLYATQLLVQIEMTAAEQSLTMKECNNISAKHRTPNARATAGGKLIRSVMQWAIADEAVDLPKRTAPPMPTLLGDADTDAATGQSERDDDAHTRGDGTRPVGAATTAADEQRMREQREQEAADWRRRQHEHEQHLEAHAHELQQQLQEQQCRRHAQQQERQQQQDEAEKTEGGGKRQRLAKQRLELQQHQQRLTQDLHLQLQQQHQAQQRPPTEPAPAPGAHQGQPQYQQQHAAQPGPHAFTTQHQAYPPHHS